jgi:hypothetical protein
MDTDAQGCQMSNYTYSQGEQTHKDKISIITLRENSLW